jgi:hypothetical protein
MKLKELPHSLYQTLKLRAIPSKEIANPKGNVLPIIVSLTTIPSRLKMVHLVVRSILCQKDIPQTVILYLNDSLKNDIPRNLRSITSNFFEIRYSPLNCSHRKLIYSLESFPNQVIVTCDDDLLYTEKWLKSLYNTHLKYPKDIVAHRLRTICYDENNEVLPYKKWKYTKGNDTEFNNLLPIGCGGVLYPPHSLLEIATDHNLFLTLAPKADDLWFKAMSFLKGTCCRLPNEKVKEAIPIMGSQ